jgi:hypothetical protein
LRFPLSKCIIFTKFWHLKKQKQIWIRQWIVWECIV